MRASAALRTHPNSVTTPRLPARRAQILCMAPPNAGSGTLPPAPPNTSGAAGVAGARGSGNPPGGPVGRLETMGLRNITREARVGELDPVFERGEEMSELSRRLNGDQNALLIGNAGVGKTAIVEGLAQEWKDEEKTFFFSLGMKDLNRQVLEPQLKQIVETVQEGWRQGFKIYLLMDELHLMENAGVLELLKEPLARPGFRVIGATTTKEFYQFFNNDATKRRFGDPVEIKALDGDRLRRLVRNIIPEILKRLGAGEEIAVPPLARQTLIDLSPLLIGRFPPDATIALLRSVIGAKRSQLGDLKRVIVEIPKKLESDLNDLIDYVNSNMHAQAAVIWKSIMAHAAAYLEAEEKLAQVQDELARTSALIITEADVRAEASNMSGLDLTIMDDLDKAQLNQLGARIRTRFIGQNQAVELVAGAIRRYKAGRRRKNAPIATFLFTGPTGAGKTEMAHTIAWLLFGDDQRVMTVDMSQCVGKAGKNQLFGPDPGFVGFDTTEGILPGFLKKKENRHGVLFLDEIDKADREVLESLLVMLDQGYIRNKKTNEKYSLEDIVVVMASNQGEAQMMRPAQMREIVKDRLAELGEGINRELASQEIMEKLNRANRQITVGSFEDQRDENGQPKYSPAFRNRLQIVPFDYLTEADLSQIADIQLKNFVRQVERDQQLEIRIGADEAGYQEVKSYLTAQSADLVNGARPLKTALVNHLDNPFSGWLISTNPSGEYVINVSLRDGCFVFEETSVKSERGKQMDVAGLPGRRGNILRELQELINKGKTVTAELIRACLVPPKGIKKIMIWLQDNPLPADLAAKEAALSALQKTLTAEDLTLIKSALPDLLRTADTQTLTVILFTSQDRISPSDRDKIRPFTHREHDPFIANLARTILERLDRIAQYSQASGRFEISPADKNRIDPAVAAFTAGFGAYLRETGFNDEDCQGLAPAVKTLVYTAKERQEQAADPKKRNIPITLQWQIDQDLNVLVQVIINCSSSQAEESRIKNLRLAYITGTNRSLTITTFPDAGGMAVFQAQSGFEERTIFNFNFRIKKPESEPIADELKREHPFGSDGAERQLLSKPLLIVVLRDLRKNAAVLQEALSTEYAIHTTRDNPDHYKIETVLHHVKYGLRFFLDQIEFPLQYSQSEASLKLRGGSLKDQIEEALGRHSFNPRNISECLHEFIRVVCQDCGLDFPNDLERQ